jgi:hypothetical protein
MLFLSGLTDLTSDGSLLIGIATPVNQQLIPRQKAHKVFDTHLLSVPDPAAAFLATTAGYNFIED